MQPGIGVPYWCTWRSRSFFERNCTRMQPGVLGTSMLNTQTSIAMNIKWFKFSIKFMTWYGWVFCNHLCLLVWFSSHCVEPLAKGEKIFFLRVKCGFRKTIFRYLVLGSCRVCSMWSQYDTFLYILVRIKVLFKSDAQEKPSKILILWRMLKNLFLFLSI